MFRLLATGRYKVYVLDNCSIEDNLPYLKNQENLVLYKADIKEKKLLPGYMEGKDFLVHLAAHTYVLESIENPKHNFEENAVATFHLLDCAAKAGIKHFIFASTGAVVGNQPPPIHEAMPCCPLSPYGASKLAGEAYCRVFSEITDMSCTVFRFSNLFGPYSRHKNSVVAKFIKRILNDQEIEIYGDGSQTRDYLYVDDLCDLFLKAFESDYKFNIFQVASGVGTSLNALMDILEKKINKKIKRKNTDFKKGEVRFNYADISKAKEFFSYKPKVGLEEGIEKTIKWFLT